MEQPVGSDFHPSRTSPTRKTRAVTGAMMWSLCSGEQGLPRRGLPTWENVTTVMAFPCAPPLPPPTALLSLGR